MVIQYGKRCAIGNNTHPAGKAYVNFEHFKKGSDGWGCLFVAGITQGLRRGHQSVGKGEGGSFGPVARLCLVVDIRDMPLHCSAA